MFQSLMIVSHVISSNLGSIFDSIFYFKICFYIIGFYAGKVKISCKIFHFNNYHKSTNRKFMKLLKIKSNKNICYFYVGCRGWLPLYHPSVPSFMLYPHFWQTDRNRSGPDLDCSSSKRNWLCSSKHGETELKQIQKELGDPDLRPEPIFFQPSLDIVFPSSHTSSPEIEDQAP